MGKKKKNAKSVRALGLYRASDIDLLVLVIVHLYEFRIHRFEIHDLVLVGAVGIRKRRHYMCV